MRQNSQGTTNQIVKTITLSEGDEGVWKEYEFAFAAGKNDEYDELLFLSYTLSVCFIFF